MYEKLLPKDKYGYVSKVSNKRTDLNEEGELVLYADLKGITADNFNPRSVAIEDSSPKEFAILEKYDYVYMFGNVIEYGVIRQQGSYFTIEGT